MKAPNQALLGGIDAKIEIFRERYNNVWQRTIRHRLFTAGHRKAQAAQFSLQKVEYLKGVSLKMKDVVILGMLSQMQEGEWWIGNRFILDIRKNGEKSGFFYFGTR